MKRFLVGAGFAAALYMLSGFSLISFQQQTQRVRWETSYQGATYSTPTPRSTSFASPFVANGLLSVGGPAYFRADAITCSWGVVGTTDGGTNNVVVDILHEDAGIDCSCTLGSCSHTAADPEACACASAFQMVPGSTYGVQLDATTACILTPAQIHCSVDLFR